MPQRRRGPHDPLILPLSDDARATRALLGGKGAALGALTRAGLPVPEGFVVTTRAYRMALGAALVGIRDSRSAQGAILALTLPEDLLRELRAAFEGLGGDGVALAVRSSAMDEDGQTLSFAGQQKSFLGVRGFEALCDRLREVWASLFGAEALIYRSEASLEAAPPLMAVVVQRLVHARSAGVCFTINPISGARQEMVVSAAPGLGETVVSGGAADTYYVRRADGRALRREIARKPSRLVAGAQGVKSESVEARDAPCLDDAELARVTQICSQIESQQGSPQDIEWAFDEEGGLWILQARPITTGKASLPGSRGGTSFWTNTNVGEALPGVGTPMTWSIIRGFSRRGFEAAFGALGLDVPESYELVGSFHGRVFLNITQFASVITQIPWMKPETILKLAGGPAVEQIEGGYEQHSSRSFLLRLPLTIPRMIGSQLTLPFAGRQWARRFRKRRDGFFARPIGAISPAALLEVLKEVDDLFDRTGLIMIACSSNFLSSYVATHELLGRWGGPEAAAREQQLFAGLDGVRSAEPGLELLRMAHHIKGHPRLEGYFVDTSAADIVAQLDRMIAIPGGAALRRDLDAFLREYGHRAPREAEIATPRWREDPTFIIDTLRTYLQAPYLPSPEEILREQLHQRRETTEAIRRHFTTGLGLIFRQVLGWSQQNARLREELRACVVDTLAMYRHAFLEIGRRLASEGALGDPEDVFFLTSQEARGFLSGDSADDFALRVIARRAAFEAFEAIPDPPDNFMLIDGVIVTTEQEPVEGRDTIEGLPGSSGRVTGPARVVIDPSAPGSTLRPGEILVAPLTDVGWTPLFLAASGVVMDKGGPLSHSCIVAREFGIPAVVNARRATERIKTGDIITLDGDAGLVYLPKRP